MREYYKFKFPTLPHPTIGKPVIPPSEPWTHFWAKLPPDPRAWKENSRRLFYINLLQRLSLFFGKITT